MVRVLLGLSGSPSADAADALAVAICHANQFQYIRRHSMIATLTGRVFSKGFDRAVVDVAGVGYEVILSTDNVARMPEKGEDAFFYIHTNVREDAITLFGFLEEQEKELFLILKTVSGIGPKLALAMLSGLRVGEICQAISDWRHQKTDNAARGGQKNGGAYLC